MAYVLRPLSSILRGRAWINLDPPHKCSKSKWRGRLSQPWNGNEIEIPDHSLPSIIFRTSTALTSAGENQRIRSFILHWLGFTLGEVRRQMVIFSPTYPGLG